MSEKAKCRICGEPLPDGEEMFNYHGYSGPCPKSPIAQATAPATTNVREAFEKWYAAYKDITLYIDGMQDAFEAGYNARSKERDAQAAAPSGKDRSDTCADCGLTRDLHDNPEEFLPASHPLQDKPPGPRCSHGVLMREFCQGCEDVRAAAPGGKEPKMTPLEQIRANLLKLRADGHDWLEESIVICNQRLAAASHPLQDKPPAAPSEQLLAVAKAAIVGTLTNLNIRDISEIHIDAFAKEAVAQVAGQDKPPAAPRFGALKAKRDYPQHWDVATCISADLEEEGLVKIGLEGVRAQEIVRRWLAAQEKP